MKAILNKTTAHPGGGEGWRMGELKEVEGGKEEERVEEEKGQYGEV